VSGGYFANAAVFLIKTLFGLYVGAVMLRLLLQWVRADFYNPLSQAIVKITNPLLRPLRRVIPALGRLDTASVVLLVALQTLSVWLIHSVVGFHPGLVGTALTVVAELLSNFIYLYIFAIIIQAIASWIAPGTYNPILALLNSVTAPLLRPIRQLLPDLGGIDFSPLVAIVLLQLALQLIVAPLSNFGG
jgi:YggT family protein